MDLSPTEFNALRRVLELLAAELPPPELRRELGQPLLALLQADHYASYVWDEASRRFVDGVSLNMDAANIARYESTYQFCSPITARLQARRSPAIASEVYPYSRLMHSSYYADFLARDGLHWGIAMHLFAGPIALGDFRIWRGQRRHDFSQREKDLLGLLQPCLTRALGRTVGETRAAPAAQPHGLSEREVCVAGMVGSGLTDKEIARQLGISPATVRTYINRLFEKLGMRRRSSLGAWSHAAGLVDTSKA